MQSLDEFEGDGAPVKDSTVVLLRGGEGGCRLGIVARNHLLLHVLAMVPPLVMSNQAFYLPPLASRVIYRVIIREFL